MLSRLQMPRFQRAMAAPSALFLRTPSVSRMPLGLAPRLVMPRFLSSSAQREKEEVITGLKGMYKRYSNEFKDTFKAYGKLAVATYLTVYVSTLSSIYFLIHFKFIKGFDLHKWLHESWIGQTFFSEKYVKLHPNVSEFIVAWVLTKPTEPARALVTLMLLPLIVRFMPKTFLTRLGVKPLRKASSRNHKPF